MSYVYLEVQKKKVYFHQSTTMSNSNQHNNQKYNMFNWDEKKVDYQTLGKTTVPMSEERMNEKKMEYAWDEFTHDFDIPVVQSKPLLRYHVQ